MSLQSSPRPQGFPVAQSAHPRPPPRSAPSSARPSALPLPAQPALGGPVSPTPSLLVSKKKRNSFSHLSLEQSPKGVEGHAVKCEKNKARACQAGQVVILIMWNSPLFMENFLLQHLWPLEEPHSFLPWGPRGSLQLAAASASNYSCRPSSLPSSSLPHPQAAVDAPSGKNKLALNQATLSSSRPLCPLLASSLGRLRPH